MPCISSKADTIFDKRKRIFEVNFIDYFPVFPSCVELKHLLDVCFYVRGEEVPRIKYVFSLDMDFIVPDPAIVGYPELAWFKRGKGIIIDSGHKQAIDP